MFHKTHILNIIEKHTHYKKIMQCVSLCVHKRIIYITMSTFAQRFLTKFTLASKQPNKNIILQSRKKYITHLYFSATFEPRNRFFKKKKISQELQATINYLTYLGECHMRPEKRRLELSASKKKKKELKRDEGFVWQSGSWRRRC